MTEFIATVISGIGVAAIMTAAVWYGIIASHKLKCERELLVKEKEKYELLLSQKKSSEVRLGQITEQLAPFLDNFKYDPKKAHFIGNPVDFVVFLDDEIVFMEVKSGESKMTKRQKDIRALINNGKVRFETMKIDGKQAQLKSQVDE